ncbi:MAG TPA: tRNA glutamyl-Q(34) synthetase GluQRS, partial [Luteolibacter sp.]|nr:tRNA glutamyl-Q(34) synthetase GluQRS [Luteolibacter sp.]
MAMCTRFAPSPTGRMHLGHALAACFARDLAATHAGGRMVLRFEDIDLTRVRPEFYDGIIEDLHWLGIAWDGEALRQTDRQEAYQDAFEQLRAMDVVYPCFCTRKDIQAEWAAMGGAPQGQDSIVYPAICQRLDEAEQAEKLASGLPHAWRLDADKAAAMLGSLDFEDLRFGRITVDPSMLGHVVLMRKDIGVSYHLAVVVDDAFQQVTHVTRGEDLLPSTHVHRMLQALLKLPAPVYHHHPLVLDEHGN